MKLVGTLFALVALASTSCSATVDGAPVGIDNRPSTSDDCDELHKLSETVTGDEHIADAAQLEELADAMSTCMTLDEMVNSPQSFSINGQPQPAETRDCYRPFVEANPSSFLIAAHNSFFDEPTEVPHRDHWVEALAACLPASYLLPNYLAPIYHEPEHLSCYDSVYRPVHQEPLVRALLKETPESDLSETELHLAFDPMYQCASFMELDLGSDLFDTLTEDSGACLESLAPRFLLFQGASAPLVTEDEYKAAFADCLTAEELGMFKDPATPKD